MTVAAPDHGVLRQAEEGCLTLAGSELDHAQDVLADLTQTVVKAPASE